MNVLIIEDEVRAANRLERLIMALRPETTIVGKLETVAEALDFLANNQPDLILSDIQLADGLSFEIYENQTVDCPIIFTTAYDQYAINAFETNGIDYLLKPVEDERLQKALEKYDQLNKGIDLNTLLKLAKSQEKPAYKSRFMIKVGDKIKSIAVDEITVFFSLAKGTYLHTSNNRNYVVEHSLEKVEVLLDPNRFFRVNRKFIVAIDAPSEIIAHSNSRLKLKIDGFDQDEVIVAREKVKEFKQWLDR